MSLVDAFSKEDRVPVTFTDFFNLVKQAAKYENVMNGVKCDVPHKYIRELTTGEKEQENQKKTGIEVAVHFDEAELEEIAERIKRQVAEEFGIPIELLKEEKKEKTEADLDPDRDQDQEPEEKRSQIRKENEQWQKLLFRLSPERLRQRLAL